MPGRSCSPDCTCGRHKWSAEKLEKRAAKVRKGVAKAKAEGKYSAARQRIWDSTTPEQRAEWGQRQSEQRKKEWAANPRRNRHYGSRKRTSKHELGLVPYMQALGYEHGTGKRIGQKIPDFIDTVDKRIYEYFGTYWHPDPTEEERVVHYYAIRGYQCQVLWEHDLFKWLTQHRHLVTPEEHEAAWKVAMVNNGYRKPATSNK
jgi:hypothetical protein